MRRWRKGSKDAEGGEDRQVVHEEKEEER